MLRAGWEKVQHVNDSAFANSGAYQDMTPHMSFLMEENMCRWHRPCKMFVQLRPGISQDHTGYRHCLNILCPLYTVSISSRTYVDVEM